MSTTGETAGLKVSGVGVGCGLCQGNLILFVDPERVKYYVWTAPRVVVAEFISVADFVFLEEEGERGDVSSAGLAMIAGLILIWADRGDRGRDRNWF